MSFLHLSSWTGGNSDSDRATVASGTPLYSTDKPAGSLASNSVRYQNSAKHVIFWPRGDVFAEPIDGVAFHGRYRLTANTANNANVRFGIGRSATEMVSLSLTAGTARPTLRVSGTIVTTAASPDAFTALVWERPIIDISSFLEGGRIDVYNGDMTAAPILSHIITAPQAAVFAGVGQPNAWQIGNDGDGDFSVTDLGVIDPADGTGETDIMVFNQARNFTVLGEPFIADGSPQDWSGSHEDINELPFDGLDFVNTEAVNAEATFELAPIAGRVGNVYAMKWQSGAKLNGTDAGETVDLTADDGSTTIVNVTMPADDVITAYYQEQPSGGALTPVSVDTTKHSYTSRA